MYIKKYGYISHVCVYIYIHSIIVIHCALCMCIQLYTYKHGYLYFTYRPSKCLAAPAKLAPAEETAGDLPSETSSHDSSHVSMGWLKGKS